VPGGDRTDRPSSRRGMTLRVKIFSFLSPFPPPLPPATGRSATCSVPCTIFGHRDSDGIFSLPTTIRSHRRAFNRWSVQKEFRLRGPLSLLSLLSAAFFLRTVSAQVCAWFPFRRSARFPSFLLFLGLRISAEQHTAPPPTFFSKYYNAPPPLPYSMLNKETAPPPRELFFTHLPISSPLPEPRPPPSQRHNYRPLS